MKKLILITLSFLTLQLFAGPLPQSKAEFCSRFGTLPNDRASMQDLSAETTNLMSFKNDGGLFNGGVCWWHSRFQRNILYLSIFRPDLARATTTQDIQNIIHQIRLGTSVVTIAGYANFAEFSADNQKLIQTELNDWQLYDGIVLGSWIDGLKGETKVKPEVLKNMMDVVYNYVEVEKKIAYQKLQIKGITSHAWLMVGLKKGSNGYEIGLIDSNNPRMTENYSYKYGDDSFSDKSYGNFVPYLEFTREELRLLSVAKTFCGIKGLQTETNPSDWARDYQIDLAEARRNSN
jgi:hypothetical protein